MKVTHVRCSMLCGTRWGLPGGTPYQTEGFLWQRRSQTLKIGYFPMTWLSFKGISASWKSRAVTGKIRVASAVKADSWQLQTAGENPSVTEWSIWFMEKQNKWLDEVRYPQWTTLMQKINGLICNDQPNPSLIRGIGRNRDSSLDQHIRQWLWWSDSPFSEGTEDGKESADLLTEWMDFRLYI